MQGLYLSHACSLIEAAERKAREGKTGGAWDRLQGAEAYRLGANKVVQFLAAWLIDAGDYSIAQKFLRGYLLHERTPTYAWIPGRYPLLNGYFEESYWAGDQGLIMGALTQFLRVVHAAGRPGDGSVEPIYDVWPNSISDGVFYNIPTLDRRQPNAVGPYRAPPPVPQFWGFGRLRIRIRVFWRYVMRCSRIDPPFAARARQDPHIVERATASGTGPNPWGTPLFRRFNTVAAAIGAWHLLGGPDGPGAAGSSPPRPISRTNPPRPKAKEF